MSRGARGRPRSSATRRTCAATRRRSGASCSRAPASRSSASSTSRRRTRLDDWLARTDCTGATAERVRELLARCRRRRRPHVARHEAHPQGAEVAEVDGDHRRQRHAARRPGPDRLRGALPRAAQPRLRHEPRRRRHARQGRPGRRGRAGVRHGRRRGARGGREHVADLRARALRARRDLRGGRRGDRDGDLHHRAHPGARHAARLHVRAAEGRDADRAELPRRAVAREGERRDHPGRGVPARARSASCRARGR